MAKRKRNWVENLELKEALCKKDSDRQDHISLHTLDCLKDVHDHLGPGTRVELVSIDWKRSFPEDKMGFPKCTETQEILSPLGEERLALVREVGGQYQIILVMEWNPLHRFFYLQYLASLTVAYCKAKDTFLDRDAKRKTVRSRTCVCPKSVRLCQCQGDNQHCCGRTYSFGCILKGRCCFNSGKWEKTARKFRLFDKDGPLESEFEDAMECAATFVNDYCLKVAPGKSPKLWRYTFGAITANLDYSCKCHEDAQNDKSTVTACLTLSQPHSSQKLVLPTCVKSDGSSVVLSVPHGSLYIFDGRAVKHGTTRIDRPNRLRPCRISLVFFRHQFTFLRNHGKEHTPVFNEETVDVLEKAQLSMKWIECRCIQGNFRKQTGQIDLSDKVLGLMKAVRKKYENCNEKPSDLAKLT